MPEAQIQNKICYGRVPDEDFEKMIPAQWWKTVFADNMYLKTDGDVVEDDEITKEEIRMLESNSEILSIFQIGSSSNSSDCGKVLDLCCGQGRHTLLLAEKYPNLRLFGHDQSAYLISLARERATNLPNAPHRSNIPSFTVGDCRNVPYENDQFDFIMVMGNSFGYFSANDHLEVVDDNLNEGKAVDVGDEGDRAVLREINRMLKKNGKMILDLVDGDYMRNNFSPRSWEWIDDQTFVCRERVLSKDSKRLHSREVITSVNRGVIRDQFYSERLYSRDELVAIMQEAGFQIDVNQNAHLDAVNTVTAAKEMSQRGQDLGMMEQRLLIFATKIQDHPRPAIRHRELKSKNVPVHPQMSAENAQAVRDWIERLSLQDLNSGFENGQSNEYKKAVIQWIESCTTATDVSDNQSVDSIKNNNKVEDPQSLVSSPLTPTASSSTNYVLREWIDRVILPPSSHIEPPSQYSNQNNSNSIALATPSLYHLLPPPPFPHHHLSVLLGDVSMPCRDKLNGRWNDEDIETRKKMIDALLDCGYDASQISIFESHRDLVSRLSTRPPSFILNLCDEGYFNDAHKELHIASFLEMCGIPYSGAGPVSLGVCYDKGFVNSTAQKLGIRVPKETHIILPEFVDPKEITFADIDKLVGAEEIHDSIIYPAFVKPMKGDNSLGITSKSICNQRHELSQYILSLVNEFGLKQFIIQEYLTGTEYSVGMIGNPDTGFHFLPILQVDYSKVIEEGLEPILGWDSKWDPSSPYWTDINYLPAKRIPGKRNQIPVNVPEPNKLHPQKSAAKNKSLCVGGLTFEEEEELKRACTILFERFGCRDYARFDWRADKEVKYDAETGEIHSLGNKSIFNFDRDDKSVDGREDSKSVNSSVESDPYGRNYSDSGHGSQNSVTSAGVGEGIRLRNIKLLEVNPNPGWCWDGKLAKMASFEGMTYPDLLKCILWASWERSFGHSKGEGRRLLADWCANAIRGERVSINMNQSEPNQTLN